MSRKIYVYQSEDGLYLTLWRKEYRKGLWAFYSESWRRNLSKDVMEFFSGWNLWDDSPEKTGFKKVGIL